MKKEIVYTNIELDEGFKDLIAGARAGIAKYWKSKKDSSTTETPSTTVTQPVQVTKQASLEIPIAKSELFIIDLMLKDQRVSIKHLIDFVFNTVENDVDLFANLDNSKKQLLRNTVIAAVKKAHEKTNINIAEVQGVLNTNSPKVAANIFSVQLKSTFNNTFLKPLTPEKLKSYYTVMLQKMVKDPKESQKMLKRFDKDPNKSLQIFKENAFAYIDAINKIAVEVIMKVLPQQQKPNLPEHKLSAQQIDRWSILAEIKK